MTTSGDTQADLWTLLSNLVDNVLPEIDSIELSGRTVLVRSDLNVPLVDGRVTDTFRIDASLDTINEVRASARRTIVASHLGRPEGADPALSMAPVAQALGERGGFSTVLAPAVFGPEVDSVIAATPSDAVIVLENTRFEPGEVRNDAVVADGLASLAEVFVSDAFGTAHRSHASNVGVATRLPSVAGRLLASEIAAFTRLRAGAERPYVVVMGGAKISDKLSLIEELLPKVDLMLIGGGMCFTLLRASGFDVGESLVDESQLRTVTRLLESDLGDKIVLPTDVVVADSFTRESPFEVVSARNIRGSGVGLDIGPETVERFSAAVAGAEAVFWNGPMGVFEWESFRAGTHGVAQAVASTSGYSVVGGGDSVAAIRLLGFEKDVAHVSSGGGAGLAMLEGSELPGISILERENTDA